MTFLSNPRLRFGHDVLPNMGYITPFLIWNKHKERAGCEMHFYEIQSSKML